MSRLTDPARSLEIIRSVSGRLSRRMARDGISQERVDRLSAEELQDMSKLVGIAHFLLCKYEDKKETKAMLEGFVGIICDACDSIDRIDDEVAELFVAAEDSAGRIRAAHGRISDGAYLGGGSAWRAGARASSLADAEAVIGALDCQGHRGSRQSI